MKKHRFKVLLSYSGSQSMGVAEAIRDLLELVLPSVKPWVASIDIEAGQRWQEVLTDTLKETRFAIICLTRENRASEWLLFEAGAIATGFDLRRVYPLVIDFTVDDLKGPLSQFQGVKCDRNGITMIIESLNKELNAEALTKFDLHTKLEKYWEGFNRKISGDWISWDEYWEKQSAVVDVLRRMMIDNIYTPDLLVGISNGGLHFADTILRRVYDNSKPLLCLWANRNNEKSYFDNDLNNSFFEGNFVNNLLGKNDKMNRELEILILDDVVGSSKTFQQVSEYLNIKFGESFEFCRFSFIFLYTIEDDIYDVMKPQLLTMYDNCRKYFDEIRFKHNTNKSKLPYLKDIRSGGVIRND